MFVDAVVDPADTECQWTGPGLGAAGNVVLAASGSASRGTNSAYTNSQSAVINDIEMTL